MERLRQLFSRYVPKRRKRGTVRFMFPALVSFAAVLGAAVISSTDASYVRLETTATTIEAGQRFTVEVFANAHVAVNAVDVTLTFDENAVEVLEVDRGQSVITIWAQDPIVEGGQVILRGGTYNRGFLGEHKIASIDLRAKSTGQSSFNATDIMLLAGDGEGTPVTVTDAGESSVNLYIYDENTTPESIGVDVEVSVITDIDGDGSVSLRDISAFMGAWASRDRIYDFNGDGRMTFRDFSIILADMFFN